MKATQRNLFVYGTLMFDEVVEALLGRKLNSVEASLSGYSRHAIQRGNGGAKGPVIFPDKNGSVEGRVLLDIDTGAADVIDRFEDAASGYTKTLVTVITPGKGEILAEAYVGTNALKALATGQWSAKSFREESLHHYLNERIPKLKAMWQLERQHKVVQSTVSLAQPSSDEWTLRATQVLYLKRNWEILEVFKGLRFKVPVVISGAILTLSSFAMKANPPGQAWVFPLVIATLAVLGNLALFWIRSQYSYTSDKIDYLYGRLGMDMDGDDFRDQDPKVVKLRSKKEDAGTMFWGGFGGITLISVICIIALLQ